MLLGIASGLVAAVLSGPVYRSSGIRTFVTEVTVFSALLTQLPSKEDHHVLN